MRYILLLRGINVGGKNKVAMADLKQIAIDVGCQNVVTYINSGNLFLDLNETAEKLKAAFAKRFEEVYPFLSSFVLLSQAAIQADAQALPS